MVQTTHGQPAAKAEVVSIILWFWVRIPVGPPLSRSEATTASLQGWERSSTERSGEGGAPSLARKSRWAHPLAQRFGPCFCHELASLPHGPDRSSFFNCMSQSSNNLASYIWSLADLLRGDFKQSQYGRIILPFTLLRRLECVLAASKSKVLAEVEKLAKQKLPEEAREKLLLRATGGLSFFNASKMDLSTLGEAGIKANLDSYIASFSKDAREIFEYFNFAEFIGQLNDANLLYKVVQRVRLSDLSPQVVSNHEMGLVFEELIRRFAESSNETAGEHFTPRDIVRLTTSLVFMEDDAALTKPGIIRTIYDPTAGTGGFLSAGMEYVHELNPRAVIRGYGQELNPESYAICKGDMLIKGQDVSRIKFRKSFTDTGKASSLTFGARTTRR